ncbi:crotonase/enoyl-CoA hydratase family protein [soil metagenome]
MTASPQAFPTRGFRLWLTGTFMTYATLKTELDGGLLWVRLARPDQLNAFTVEMANELEALFRAVNTDDAVRVIIVTGEGRAFCAGMDLSREGNVFGLNETLSPTLQEMVGRADDPVIRDGVRDTGGRVTLAIHDCDKPVIAAINGAAVGIGATMTLAMDFRLASEKARIGFVFGRLGIVPEACSTWFLPRLVGLQQALEWVYTADIVDAAEALRAGLVRSVHAPETLLADAETFARRLIADRSPSAVAMSRHMMRRNSALASPVEAHNIESLAMLDTSRNDGREGVQAFKEKRTPVFSRAVTLPVFFRRLLGRAG